MPLQVKKVQMKLKDGQQYVDGDLLFNVDAQAWARGTRNGQPITDINDPAYNNNAKYYVDSSVETINETKNAAINAVIGAGTAAAANFPVTADACDTLAGDFAPTYVPNQAYAIGDYCTYQYRLYQCNTAIAANTDSSFITAHWTAVEIGSEVSNLKNVLYNKTFSLEGSYWQRKGLASATGIASNSTTRISTINYLSNDIEFVSVSSGYDFAVFAWDNTDDYKGVWDGSAWVNTGITWRQAEISLKDLPGGYRYRILAKSHSGTNVTITLAECININFKIKKYTDTTLLVSGAAADSKIVGNEINNLKSDFDIVSDILDIEFHNLPSGYTEKPYIETTGNALVDSGVNWETHPKVVIDVLSRGGIFFGNWHTNTRRIYGSIDGNWFYGSQVADASDWATSYINKRVTIDFYDTYLKVNGTTIKTFDSTSVTGSINTLRLFGRKYTGTSSETDAYAASGTRIYRATFSTYADNEWTTVFDGIPCVRDSDSAAGFYDLISNTFKGAETGTLTAGEYASLNDVLNRLDTAEQNIQATDSELEYIVNGVTSKFADFSQKNVNATSGKITDTGAENCIVNETLIPIDSVYKAISSYSNIRVYMYNSSGEYIGLYGTTFGEIYNDEIAEIKTSEPLVYYVRIRFGDTTHPVTLNDYVQNGVSLVLFNYSNEKEDESGDIGYVTFVDIAEYGTDGVFTPADSDPLTFNIRVPYNGIKENQIFTCIAKFERSAGVTQYPTITFKMGSGLNRTGWYTIGEEGTYTTQQWRVIRYPGDTKALNIEFSIPVGVTCTIKDFFNQYTDIKNQTPYGIRINSHQRFPMTPPDTIPGMEMAVKAGAVGMIQIPKRLSDGTWIFYHDDSLSYDDTYIRQADGSELPSTYDRTLWNTIDFDTANSWDWGISKGALFAGTKPMRMETFFTICGKTGIMPMLSIHPWDDNDVSEIYGIAKKCGILSRLGIKCAASHIAKAYEIFGNDIESYTIDVSSETAHLLENVNDAITKFNAFSNCTTRRVIELFLSCAYYAYFSENQENQFDAYKLISDAGYECACAQQSGIYHPTEPNTNSILLKASDIEFWKSKGVTEFTYEYHFSFGLNW